MEKELMCSLFGDSVEHHSSAFKVSASGRPGVKTHQHVKHTANEITVSHYLYVRLISVRFHCRMDNQLAVIALWDNKSSVML